MTARPLLAATWASVAILVSGSVAAQEAVTVVMADGATLNWRGIPAEESAGTAGLAMLYPAPSAGGLLAAILTHAAMVQGGREAERNAKQAEADKALLALQPHLASLKPLEVLAGAVAMVHRQAAPRMAADPKTVFEGSVMEVQPAFSVTQDLRHFVLDNAVKLYPAGKPGQARWTQVVRVVSAARAVAGVDAASGDDAGRVLQREVESMLAHSLDVALLVSDGHALKDAPAKTYRYAFGGGEKMERGQALAGGCARVVIRNLRDWLMSVPLASVEGVPSCPDPYRLDTGMAVPQTSPGGAGALVPTAPAAAASR